MFNKLYEKIADIGCCPFKPLKLKLGMEAITMRDYFAAAAVTGCLASSDATVATVLSKHAYNLADAMMEERSKEKNLTESDNEIKQQD